MSICLTFIPIPAGTREFENSDVIYPQNRIELSGTGDVLRLQREVFDAKARALPPEKKIILRERGNRPIDTDPYGARLTYVFPPDLKKIVPARCRYFNKWDKNVLRCLRDLPQDTMIILFWH